MNDKNTDPWDDFGAGLILFGIPLLFIIDLIAYFR